MTNSQVSFCTLLWLPTTDSYYHLDRLKTANMLKVSHQMGLNHMLSQLEKFKKSCMLVMWNALFIIFCKLFSEMTMRSDNVNKLFHLLM